MWSNINQSLGALALTALIHLGAAPAAMAAPTPAVPPRPPASSPAVQSATVKPAAPATTPVPAPALSAVKAIPPTAPTSAKPSIITTDLPAAKPAPPAPEWVIRSGLLRRQLEGWATKSGYQLIWKARHDFDMDADATFRDTFTGAIQSLLMRMHEQGNLLRATIYQDNRVIEVTEE